jgi:predicted dehydrogenase
MIRIGVIGYGYWGPNIVRYLRSLEHAEVASICHTNPASLRRAKQAYPDAPELTNASII